MTSDNRVALGQMLDGLDSRIIWRVASEDVEPGIAGVERMLAQ